MVTVQAMRPVISAFGRFASSLPSLHPAAGGNWQKPERALRHCLLPAALLAALVSSAAAEEAGDAAANASVTLERHFTTNALDSDLELSDWYTLLRGSLAHEIPIEDGRVRLGFEFQGKHYDLYDFEDDLSLALTAEASRKLSERFEIRGTLSWQRFSEGDDLPLGPVVLTTRTDTDRLIAGFELGADLGSGLTLVLGAADNLEVPSKTSFPSLPIAAVELKPQRNRLRLSAALSRSEGSTAYGLRAVLEDTRAGPRPLGVSYRQLSVQGEGRMTLPRGVMLAGALGLQWLEAELDLYEELRPTLQLAAIKKFDGGLELRGSFVAAYQSDDTDDPLASWVERLEIEARAPLRERFTIGAGVFAERRRNLQLGDEERLTGVYGEFVCHLDGMTDILFRLGVLRDVLSIADIDKHTLDAYVGVTRRL